MRVDVGASLFFFLFHMVLAWVRPLPRERRLRATLLGMAGLLCTAFIVFVDFALIWPRWPYVVRAWLPAPMMLLAYWQAGQFFTAPNPKLQARLESFDQRWLARVFPFFAQRSAVGAYLEVAYLFCYPLVPLAFGVLYFTRVPGTSDFWAVVLPASYFCYAMVPFFQTLPPRTKEEQQRFGSSAGGLRGMNLGILRRASIQANTFPSAHVAASLAASLVVMRVLPGVGAALLWISISIAAAAVLRRYHYALDILAGAAVAGAVFLTYTLCCP